MLNISNIRFFKSKYTSDYKQILNIKFKTTLNAILIMTGEFI